ncbi:type II secretion system F family protein [Roseateles sp. BYS180W]|uniref:Type II secretion system F family protein n=1 Tax=Roseateles rivi TaxID=3299028 RepID=A0ABW7FX49_9BURK
MPSFEARVFVPGSGAQWRRVQAADALGVAAALGVPPTHVLELRSAAQAAPQRVGRKLHRPMQLFSQELAVLLNAGISLLEALGTLSEKERHEGVRQALLGVADWVRQGQPLSAALRAQPQAFDELLCALVAANERTGQLGHALAQHARYLAWVEQLRARLLAACVYPALLLVAGSAVIVFLLWFVLPRFSGILDGLGQELPWGSRLLMGLSQALQAHPWWSLSGAALLLALGVAAVGSQALRAALLARLWTLPGLAPRLRVLALARLYRCLGLLLQSGVPALAALRIAREVMALPWRAAVDAAALQVEQGGRLSEALEAQGLATPVALRMARVGERSGELAQMLERAAAFHDEEAVRLTELITRAINPALMLLMGVVIGTIIVLMYLPIFQLVEQVQ